MSNKNLDLISTQGLIEEIERRLGLKADLATTLSEYGIIDAMTETEIKEYTDAKIASAYHDAGSLTFEELPVPSSLLVGHVYNITNDFTTTSDFVEGAGKEYTEGSNVGVVQVGSGADITYKFDVFSGFVDTSNQVSKPEFPNISSGELTDMWIVDEANYLLTSGGEILLTELGENIELDVAV